MNKFLLVILLLGVAGCNNSQNMNTKQLFARPVHENQHTLVVQIRRDQPGLLVVKNRSGAHSQQQHHLLAHPHVHANSQSNAVSLPQYARDLRAQSPIGPTYFKPLRKPLKVKLTNARIKKPFMYDKPTAGIYSKLKSLPLEIQNIDNAEPLAPIYTVAAPNLAVQHQHIRHLEHASSLPSRGHTTKLKYTSSKSSYSSVHENETNDQTIRDPISGSQRFIAPDLDPSLKTTKLKHPTESFNIPSNNKPLPSDVLNNHLHAQPLVHILSDQTAPQTMPMYPIQFTPVAAQPIIAADHMPIYNPAYLVSLSNQLYTKHKQQLFQPNTDHGSVVKTGYVNTDLTQVVASNGQILQAAKDPQKNIHPVLQGAPQYEALVAPSAAQRQTGLPITESSLTLTSAKDGGFIVSNFYSNSRESSAYADNKAHRQHLETDPAAFELQRQQDLPQIYLEHVHLHDQDQLPLRELYIQTKSPESTETSFENNQRLINKHLVDHTPLRIFVPDEETTFETQRKQNRSDGA